ncbi:MAG: TetR family transcriptional regulator [Anaerolineaceae bacterium]|nr:TetR family transcriptional regulator [Anaerolineaceae bacterium]
MSDIDTHLNNRAERRRMQSHQQLLRATAQLMTEKSYSALTIKAITERADLGYGTFYLHFKDLDDAVWEVIYQMAEEARLQTEAQISGLPFPIREYQSWVFLFDFAAQTRQEISQVFGQNGSATLLQRYQNYLAALHEENLTAGHYSSGLELPPAFLAQFITGALVRLLIWWSETPNTYTPKQMADMMYQTVYRQPPPR